MFLGVESRLNECCDSEFTLSSIHNTVVKIEYKDETEI